MVKGLVVTSSKSGSGKTIAALAVMKMLSDKGIKVAPYKAGPDFIDTSHYNNVCGVEGRNLDSFMMDDEFLKWNFCDGLTNRHCAVVEGVMGLFDGYGSTGSGSTAEIAKKLRLPVILVIDAKGMSQSILPIIHGFLNWDKDVKILGVILNKVNSASHYAFMKEKIEKLGVACFGYIPVIPELEIASRHLGIKMGFETPKQFVTGLDKAVTHLESDKILNLIDMSQKTLTIPNLAVEGRFPVSVMVAKDEAFCFVYKENLRLLSLFGAGIKYFSPLNDELLENADLIYLPGGYPELYLEKLSKNKRMMKSLKEFSEAGGFIYAECGGLMYLSETIKYEDESYNGVGVFPFDISISNKYTSLGYVNVETVDANPLFRKNIKLKAHRFHYSYISKVKRDVAKTYILERKGVSEQEGYAVNNSLASYAHINFGSNISAVKLMLENIVSRKSHLSKLVEFNF